MKPIMYKGRELPFQPQAGDILVVRNEFTGSKPMTYLSTAIRKIDDCPYNHSAAIVEANGLLYTNEALAHGIVKKTFEKSLDRGSSYGKCYIAILRPKEKIDPVEYSVFADEYLGTKYDVTSLVFHQLIYRLPKMLKMRDGQGDWTGPWLGKIGDDSLGKMVCSEYVAMTHKLTYWWCYSTGDLINSPFFEVMWEEKKFLGSVSGIPSWE